MPPKLHAAMIAAVSASNRTRRESKPLIASAISSFIVLRRRGIEEKTLRYRASRTHDEPLEPRRITWKRLTVVDDKLPAATVWARHLQTVEPPAERRGWPLPPEPPPDNPEPEQY